MGFFLCTLLIRVSAVFVPIFAPFSPRIWGTFSRTHRFASVRRGRFLPLKIRFLSASMPPCCRVQTGTRVQFPIWFGDTVSPPLPSCCHRVSASLPPLRRLHTGFSSPIPSPAPLSLQTDADPFLPYYIAA